ncbi:MAG: hypothetical protein ACK4N5_17115 [Myxococcales bacterium]
MKAPDIIAMVALGAAAVGGGVYLLVSRKRAPEGGARAPQLDANTMPVGGASAPLGVKLPAIFGITVPPGGVPAPAPAKTTTSTTSLFNKLPSGQDLAKAGDFVKGAVSFGTNVYSVGKSLFG